MSCFSLGLYSVEFRVIHVAIIRFGHVIARPNIPRWACTVDLRSLSPESVSLRVLDTLQSSIRSIVTVLEKVRTHLEYGRIWN